MSHIAIVRQRIKAIQIIQKTTSAMRLIAMSLQSRLRKREAVCTQYLATVRQLQAKYDALYLQVARFSENITSQQKPRLVILIGSHKGLCGTFNDQLFTFFQANYQRQPQDMFLTIGTHATRFFEQQGFALQKSFNQFSLITFASIAHAVTELLFLWRVDSVVVFSQHPYTFFIQRPQITQFLVPRVDATQSPLASYLAKLDLQAHMLGACYESLLAEQAARFLSMDSATRNADELLSQLKLEYNKTRQALVTRELIELSSGFTLSV